MIQTGLAPILQQDFFDIHITSKVNRKGLGNSKKQRVLEMIISSELPSVSPNKYWRMRDPMRNT